MKRILITGGPTNEAVDEVMKITNMSTGKLSLQLAKRALACGCQVCLIVNESVTRSDLFERYGLKDEANLEVIPVESTQDMLTALDQARGTRRDVVIHASAVGDYKPEFTFRMEDMAAELARTAEELIEDGTKLSFNAGSSIAESDFEEAFLSVLTNPSCKVDDSTKISSYEPHLTVKLTLTTKLIARLRDWYPDAVLIGFKLLENVPHEHLVEVAQKLCEKNRMDYILANDLAELRQGRATRYMVNARGFTGIAFNAPKEGSPDLADYAAEHWF